MMKNAFLCTHFAIMPSFLSCFNAVYCLCRVISSSPCVVVIYLILFLVVRHFVSFRSVSVFTFLLEFIVVV